MAGGIGAHMVTQPPGSTNINEGSTLVVVAQALGTATVRYQWDHVTSGSPGTPIAGRSATLTIPGISASAYNGHSLALTVSNAYGQATSQSISLNIIPGPLNSVTILPPSLTVYAGVPVLFTVTAQGSQPFSYQWALMAFPWPAPPLPPTPTPRRWEAIPSLAPSTIPMGPAPPTPPPPAFPGWLTRRILSPSVS